jgi:protein-S-isoprenylcysteine O-methyltransferase Ste14
MLHSNIIRILIIISFFFFGYNLTYIILFKRRHKNNNLNQDNSINLKNSRIYSRIGIHIINIFIFLCCLNIFFYNYWKLIFPSISFFCLDSIIQIIGFTLVMGGNICLSLAYRKLGINWAYPIDGMKQKRKLVKTGIYSKIRHPIYLSFNIMCIGFNLILLDWFLLILYIIGAIGLYLQAIDEEKILFELFGNEYKEYIEGTGRFFVKLRNKKKY